MAYVQAEFRRRNCRPNFFLLNQCCKADCLENTVNFSDCNPLSQTNIFLCAAFHTLRYERTRTFEGSLQSSKCRRSIDPAPPLALDYGCRTSPCGGGPAPSAGACCSEGRVRREGLLLRPQRRWHGRLIKLVALDERCALGRRSQAAVS